jgi:hypothetical protein
MVRISDIDIYPENPFLVHDQNIPLLFHVKKNSHTYK